MVDNVDQDAPLKIEVKREQDTTGLGTGILRMVLGTAYAPIRLFLSALSIGLATFRPFAPQLIPLAVFAVLIPLVVFLSLSAGWVVWRNVAVGWEAPLYLQYGDGASPYAQVPLPKFAPQQRYDLSLHLLLPATDANLALGNFMTSLTLSTPANKTLTSVRRPAIAIPSRTPFFLRKSDLIDLEVHMLESFIAGTPRVVASVEIGRRDGWTTLGRGEGREVSIMSASVRGLIVHHGIRGLVTRFPLASAFIASFTFLMIMLSILSACILPTVLQRRLTGAADNIPIDGSTNSPPIPVADISSTDGDEKIPRRRRSRPSRSSTRRTDIKTEVTASTIPPADTKPDPLRRRPSRLSERVSEDSDS